MARPGRNEVPVDTSLLHQASMALQVNSVPTSAADPFASSPPVMPTQRVEIRPR
jgi:hypothetical protein